MSKADSAGFRAEVQARLRFSGALLFGGAGTNGQGCISPAWVHRIFFC
jgi:hypothetical protein